MNGSRPLVLQISLVVGLVAWVGASFSSMVHKIVIEHVVCAEHGEVVETAQVDADATVAETPGPALHAGSLDPAHDHGCIFELVVFEASEVSVSTSTVATLDRSHVSTIGIASPPRGDPLHYAPKTSPPIAS